VAAKTPVNENQAQLWVVKDNKLKAVNVTVGNSDGINTAILSGVAEGDIIALEYSAATVKSDDEQASADQSPFAPQPPGKKK
jgi:hypothetical protein